MSTDVANDAWADRLVAELVNDRMMSFAKDENERLSGEMALVLQAAESPIEAKLAFALIASNDKWQYGMPFNSCTALSAGVHALDLGYMRKQAELMRCATSKGADSYIAMGQQVKVGSHRADILLSCTTGSRELPPFDVVVECDGHEFHERTKQQAARDRARDRAMSAAGLIVMRFTGSEIHADADACASEVMGLIWNRATGRVGEA